MNILFFTVSAGAGHNKVAKTVSDYIETYYPQNNVQIIDTFNYIHPHLHKMIIETYVKSIKYIPALYRFIYKRSEFTDSSISDVSEFFNQILLSRKLSKLLSDFTPDVIVCTHPFPAEALSVMKRKGKINIPIVSILTDYTIHPSWINKEVDYYIFPNENFSYEFHYWNIPNEKARFLGIPVNENFNIHHDRDLLCESLHIKNTFTVLMMGGGLGLGMSETIHDLLSYPLDLQILVVTGKNQELYDHVQNLHIPHIKVFGFIDNIHELMSVSDVIITKPGGITVTECLIKELPIVITSKLPGQEERNTEFILNNGIGMIATNSNTLISCLSLLKEDKNKYNIYKENMKKIKKSHAAKDISNFLLTLNKNSHIY
ncbi:MGDG synthase family glycosyltransferase [Anaerophilus nitritogenes]|uniref:MGDG synthase family glycosyltransferase n=1 Tax=Anaerophilus nitritogenes TaxID=2498136 RepID=UPI00101D7CF3|nr:glycosyltransferase [Anaerophilus nitritogenes]